MHRADGEAAGDWRQAAGWIIILAWTASAVLPFVAPSLVGLAAQLQFAALLAFAWVHGSARYGLRGIALLFAAVVVIVNLFENLSIATGFPFGFYEHHAAMGPKLFLVPIIVGLCYFAAGYVAWAIANTLLSEIDRDKGTPSLFALAIAAAFIVTGWDAVADPPGATALHNWTWWNGGGYYGVPLSNFGGWLLTTSTAFLVGGWLIRRHGRPIATGQSLGWWLQPALLLAIQPLPSALAMLTMPARLESDGAGTVWNTAHIYEGTTVVGIVTCLAFGLIAAFAACRKRWS